MKKKSNGLLVQFGIFMGIISAFFLILSLFTVLSRKNWEKGLRQAVENVLGIEEYSIGEMISIDEKDDEAFCFKVFHDEDSEQGKFSEGMVLIMRMTTYYGPQPAVFVYEKNSVNFKGIAYMRSSVKEEFMQTQFNRQLDFWKNRAENIFKKIEQNSNGGR